jgi:hypothetical protein
MSGRSNRSRPQPPGIRALDLPHLLPGYDMDVDVPDSRHVAEDSLADTPKAGYAGPIQSDHATSDERGSDSSQNNVRSLKMLLHLPSDFLPEEEESGRPGSHASSTDHGRVLLQLPKSSSPDPASRRKSIIARRSKRGCLDRAEPAPADRTRPRTHDAYQHAAARAQIADPNGGAGIRGHVLDRPAKGVHRGDRSSGQSHDRYGDVLSELDRRRGAADEVSDVLSCRTDVR